MENCWNLKILFENEEAWRQAMEELPGRAESIREAIRGLETLVQRQPGESREHRGYREPDRKREDASEGIGEEIARELETILRALEEMVRISARAEIWLSRQVAMFPVDPYYAGLSDYLDRQETGELPLMRELQRVLRQIPDLDRLMDGGEYLRSLRPWARHLCRRIIPLETLDSETGGGWYRLRALLDPVSLEYRGETVSFRELLELNGYAEWGEEMHPCTYDLCCRFYEECGDRAAEILLDVLRRDEEDYRREGSDSWTVYLRDYGFSRDTVNAMIEAVEEALPGWYACKRSLDAWHRSIAWEEAESEAELPEEDRPEGENIRCEAGEEEELRAAEGRTDAEETADTEEDIDARNEAAYLTLRDAILEQFADFHPEFAAMVEDAFAGKWVWINDDPLAGRDQHASMIPETGLSYIVLAADCYLPAAAHELGHAWHNRCLKDQNILYNQNEVLMELPGNLAALWSYRWMIDHRCDTLRQLEEAGAPAETVEYYRALADSPAVYEDLLSETVANIYDGYASFCFERELRSRILREDLKKEDITEMYLRYRRRLLLPENRDWKLDPFRWIERGSLFSCRSFYNLPYMISMLLAYRILEEYRELPDGGASGASEARALFWDRLTGLLRRMNTEPSEEVLSEYFREDVRQPEFWRKCTRSLESLFAEIISMGEDPAGEALADGRGDCEK